MLLIPFPDATSRKDNKLKIMICELRRVEPDPPGLLLPDVHLFAQEI
jgi:hypothetical protein